MEWQSIESRQNPAVKFAASLAEKKARDAAGAFLADGSTILIDLAAAGVFPEAVYLSATALSRKEEVECALQGAPVKGYVLAPHVFEKLTAEKGSEGIVSRFGRRALEEALPLPPKGKFIALENLQDPGNVGTVLRTAVSFGFDGVLLCGSADPFGPKAVRASMGAFARIPVKAFPHTDALMDHLKERGIKTYAACLHEKSVPVTDCSPETSFCILIGNEGKGLSPRALERSEYKTVIPMRGMESLNAAVAAAVLMWEWGGKEEGRE